MCLDYSFKVVSVRIIVYMDMFISNYVYIKSICHVIRAKLEMWKEEFEAFYFSPSAFPLLLFLICPSVSSTSLC